MNTVTSCTFTRSELVGPCLYIWRRGEEVLYVGGLLPRLGEVQISHA